MNKMLSFFSRHRLLDGYLGILGFVLHYRILANYGGWFHLFNLSLRNVFFIDLAYHPRPSKYPPIQFRLDIAGREFVNNGREAAEEISAFVEKWMADKESKRMEAIDEIAEYVPQNKQEIISRIL